MSFNRFIIVGSFKSSLSSVSPRSPLGEVCDFVVAKQRSPDRTQSPKLGEVSRFRRF